MSTTGSYISQHKIRLHLNELQVNLVKLKALYSACPVSGKWLDEMLVVIDIIKQMTELQKRLESK